MKKILIFILLILFCYSEQKNVSVLRFKAKGVSDIEAESISDFFAVGLVKSRNFNVLDRENMKNILEEQEFQNSGCTDQTCAVEIGKLLNMDYIFTGSVHKIGDERFITVNMVKIETGQIEKSGRSDSFNIGDISEKIDALIENFIDDKEEPKKVVKKENKAKIEIQKKIQYYKKSLKRNIVFTSSSVGVSAIGYLTGYFFKKKTGKVYEEYINTYNSKEAESLGNKLDNSKKTSNAFYYLSESGLLLTTVFGIWTSLDYINYRKYKNALKKYSFNIIPTISENHYNVKITLKY